MECSDFLGGKEAYQGIKKCGCGVARNAVDVVVVRRNWDRMYEYGELRRGL